MEEILDLYFFRFLGYGFVKMVAWSSITPNQVTYLGMVFGLISAGLFCQSHLVWAGVLLLIANVMDCADGQLARLKKNGTYLGRVVDGFFDYIVGSTTIIAGGVHLAKTMDLLVVILFTLAAGLSRAFQNILVDQRRLFRSKTESTDSDAFVQDEQDLLQHLAEAMQNRKSWYERMILKNGLSYIALQRKSIRVTGVTFNDFKLFQVIPQQRSRLMLYWSWLGSTTHISAAIFAAFIGRIDFYFWYSLVVGNVYLAILVLWENVLIRRCETKKMEEK